MLKPDTQDKVKEHAKKHLEHYVDFTDAEVIALSEPFGKVQLKDGRFAQVQITITTIEDDFIDKAQYEISLNG